MIAADGSRVYGDARTARPVSLPGRRITDVVTCPDCGHEADPLLGGNHGGQCAAINPMSTGGNA